MGGPGPPGSQAPANSNRNNGLNHVLGCCIKTGLVVQSCLLFIHFSKSKK